MHQLKSLTLARGSHTWSVDLNCVTSSRNVFTASLSPSTESRGWSDFTSYPQIQSRAFGKYSGSVCSSQLVWPEWSPWSAHSFASLLKSSWTAMILDSSANGTSDYVANRCVLQMNIIGTQNNLHHHYTTIRRRSECRELALSNFWSAIQQSKITITLKCGMKRLPAIGHWRPNPLTLLVMAEI